MAKKEAKAPVEGGAGGKSKLKLIILVVVALLLAISLSVGATWFFLSRGDKSAEPAKEEGATAASARQPAIYQDLAPAFVVNFSQNGRQRYMQVSVSLMARDQAQLDALKVHMPVLRNKLVMLFSGQNFDTLITPVGKEMLRQQATATVQELAKQETGAVTVEQVLFTNFVLQ
ncbi:flagellar basal body-associated protein FliL [Pseudomonas sp. LFM046]|uniref:flagellar basal body-associated protein FliL n=1 Tax=Pseudomonas sp. LFM046 TaxID=1608357 RepID=UPI0005CFD843|nr:flagellar basal body-associated protein FliL [Pseudomonas sp. LFM046]